MIMKMGCMVPPPFSETCNIKYIKGQNTLGFTLIDLRKDLQSNGSISAVVSIASIEVHNSEPNTTGSDHQARVPTTVHIPIEHPTENIPPSPKSVGCGSETIRVHTDVHRSSMIETSPYTEINGE